MKRAFAFTLCCLFLAAIMTAPCANAATAQNKTENKTKTISTVAFGTFQYPTDEFRTDFIAAAFSNEIWGRHEYTAHNTSALLDGLTSAESKKWRFKDQQEWWYKYATYPDGLPRHNAINKWTQEIRIGLTGWTEFGHDYSAHITSLIPDIEKITGLPVKLVQENPNLKIRTLLYNELENDFKFARITPGVSSEYPSYRYENYLLAGVPFTPKTKAQVDGYFLPESDNSIGYAECRISPFVGTELIETLMTECLLRTLGLPEIINGLEERLYERKYPPPFIQMLRKRISEKGTFDPNNSLLGRWNKAHEAHSRTGWAEGEGAYWMLGEDWNMIIPPVSPTPEQLKENFPHHLTDKEHLFKTFTPYDRLMTSTLYCPDIKPGMDKYQVLMTLKDSACYRSLLEQYEYVREPPNQ
ncbi:MAG: hypothetical protein HND56_04420 [Pseudomonadota bacterium]|nr:hypothetical protein [Pseudomonadota bacterium]QKK04980.1 MAG: hypothetical protein HND56_04420 [Pseudomonadota bacterium]